MSDLSRRRWLEMALAGAAGVKLGCGGASKRAEEPRPEPPIDPSPAAGTFEVRDRAATLWVFTGEIPRVGIELEPRVEPAQPLPPLSTHSGRTTSLRISGLAPDTQHRFRAHRFDRGTPITDWHYFRTAPAPDADAGCRFLAAADFHIRGDELAPRAFEVMRGLPASFLITLGDWPYTDRAPEARTVEQYRERLRATRLRPAVRHMMLRMPIAAIYDDHEVENDWDEHFRRTQPERLAAGLAAWDEWFPTAGARPGVRYRSWRWGKHAEIFILDTRLYRSANKAADDAAKTMLGPVQKAWLAAGLRASAATFKIVVSSVPLSYGTTSEHWNAFTTERAELVALLESVPGVVVLSGDQHWFAAHRHEGGLREFQVGPTQAFTRLVPPPAPGVLERLEVPNFGDVEITPGPEPSLLFTARSAIGGGILYQERLSAAHLSG